MSWRACRGLIPVGDLPYETARARLLLAEAYRAERNYEGLEMYILEKLMGK